MLTPELKNPELNKRCYLFQTSGPAVEIVPINTILGVNECPRDLKNSGVRSSLDNYGRRGDDLWR
jgi:hypothetical protein